MPMIATPRSSSLRIPVNSLSLRALARSAQMLRDGCYGRRAEEILKRNVAAEAAQQTVLHLDEKQGMPAHVEEVVVDPDVFRAQHFLPDRGHAALDLRPGRLPLAGRRCARRRKRALVHFSVGRKRNRFERHYLRRRHVLGQGSQKPGADGGRVDLDAPF